MNKSSPIRLIILCCAILITSCVRPWGTPAPARPMLVRDAASSYSAEFHIQFTGVKSWSYLLKARKSPTLREINLHIEGLEKTQNPGDIRMVTDNTTTWMTGEGTDQQCVQFPNREGMDPTFIYPESLVSVMDLGNVVKLVGEEQLDDVTVLHFHAAGASSGPWRDATIDLWQEKGTGMLRQFKMTAAGDDPFFATGSGNMDAIYVAGPLGSDSIEPVTGCEISVPLPEAIGMFVRFPGMASFESKSSVEELVQFFQATLPGQNWIEKEPPLKVEGATVLSYQHGAEEVEIQVEVNPAGGSSVKLLFTQTQ
jgi:hypothetical protein